MVEAYHIPAMLKETIEGLAIKPAGTYVDVTFGGGGHSRAILNKLHELEIGKLEIGHLYSFDQDSDALTNAILTNAGRSCIVTSAICATGWTITEWII